MLGRFVFIAIALAASTAGATTIDSKSVPRSTGWTSRFEAGYTAYGKTSYTADTTPGVSGDKISIDQKLTIWARVFDTQKTLGDVRGFGYRNVNGSADYNTEVWSYRFDPYTFSAVYDRLWDEDWDPADGIINLSDYLDWTFFSAEKRFYAVIKVKGSLKGEIGYYALGTSNSGFIGARLAPYIGAYVKITAGIDVWVAEGGAYGNIHLVTAEVPIYANVGVNGAGRCTGYNADIDISEVVTWLYGEGGVYYRAFWYSPKEYELWSFSGGEHTNSLYTPADREVCL